MTQKLLPIVLLSLAAHMPTIAVSADNGKKLSPSTKQPSQPVPAKASTVTTSTAGHGEFSFPVYQPPKRGAPAARIGGGTRGEDSDFPEVYVLAPDHVGLTMARQPTLSWYMSRPTSMRFEFSLISDDGIDPILEVTLETEKLQSGIQGIDLSSYGISLEPGVVYQWSVALVPDQNKRSSDVIASGMIQRQELHGEMKQRLEQAGTSEDVFILAQGGYWYDAVATLSRLIAQEPENSLYRQQRAALLDQAGLPGRLGN